MRKVYKRATNCFHADTAALRAASSLLGMKKLIERLLQAVHATRKRQVSDRLPGELDAHTLRDIGLDRAGEDARREAVRRRLHIGLY
jgi:uncharacterized protein YjiS (DUF1127 family)